MIEDYLDRIRDARGGTAKLGVRQNDVDALLSALVPDVGTVISTPVTYGVSKYVAEPRLRQSRPGLLGAVTMTFFLSTASVLADPRRVLNEDASVVLGPLLPFRRRISLAEARRIALDAIKFEDERFAKAAELEAREFLELFGWTPE